MDCESFLADGSGDHQKFIKSSLLVECLASITNIPNPDRREAEQIALEAMEDAHHPCIGEKLSSYCTVYSVNPYAAGN